MAQLRVVFLWHMHQPYYKDLVTGEYRLPWVRSHALKDYYGMVKLLDEFPQVHQTFNLVPSLITQIQDYASGSARDPFLEIAAKPAVDLSVEERRFALAYLFQANPVQMIGRYPRYQELWTKFIGAGGQASKAEPYFQKQDYTDLQVLSQIAWFDEFFLGEPEIAELVNKGRNFTPEDRSFVIRKERELCGRVLPAYAEAARQGRIEISTSPFYHPILPLLCDTNQGAVSSPQLPLPSRAFRHPEDAREQIKRGLDLHEEVFGVRPVGLWPSEGSVSEEVLAIASELGVRWMATDEGVLGRTLGIHFTRSAEGRLSSAHAEALYSPYRYEKGEARMMNVVFRDHSLSDLIGFVYSGVAASEAAEHFVRNIKECAKPVLANGSDALVAVILDGENAWEFYPRSGREFLRRVYDALQRDPEIEALAVREALDRHGAGPKLTSLVPGSWINANFNVWIGAPEDNKAWDYLNDARDFYQRAAPTAEPEQRQLAMEELLIAEGSDWNWWYGPEHHSANDRDFDELYRKHLTNVYQALGVEAPDYLAHPIAMGVARPTWAPQTAYIHPRIGSGGLRYFDWIGAAMYTCDQHSGAMHGKTFLLDSAYAGIDEKNLYGRLDFAGGIPGEQLQLSVNLEIFRRPVGTVAPEAIGTQHPSPTASDTTRMRLLANLNKKLEGWELRTGRKDEVVLASSNRPEGLQVVLPRNFEFQVPLEKLGVAENSSIRLRFGLWRDGMPVDAVPLEGSMTLQVADEEQLQRNIFENIG